MPSQQTKFYAWLERRTWYQLFKSGIAFFCIAAILAAAGWFAAVFTVPATLTMAAATAIASGLAFIGSIGLVVIIHGSADFFLCLYRWISRRGKLSELNPYNKLTLPIAFGVGLLAALTIGILIATSVISLPIVTAFLALLVTVSWPGGLIVSGLAFAFGVAVTAVKHAVFGLVGEQQKNLIDNSQSLQSKSRSMINHRQLAVFRKKPLAELLEQAVYLISKIGSIEEQYKMLDSLCKRALRMVPGRQTTAQNVGVGLDAFFRKNFPSKLIESFVHIKNFTSVGQYLEHSGRSLLTGISPQAVESARKSEPEQGEQNNIAHESEKGPAQTQTGTAVKEAGDHGQQSQKYVALALKLATTQTRNFKYVQNKEAYERRCVELQALCIVMRGKLALVDNGGNELSAQEMSLLLHWLTEFNSRFNELLTQPAIAFQWPTVASCVRCFFGYERTMEKGFGYPQTNHSQNSDSGEDSFGPPTNSNIPESKVVRLQPPDLSAATPESPDGEEVVTDADINALMQDL